MTIVKWYDALRDHVDGQVTLDQLQIVEAAILASTISGEREGWVDATLDFQAGVERCRSAGYEAPFAARAFAGVLGSDADLAQGLKLAPWQNHGKSRFFGRKSQP